jgi:hypothetical protein
MTRVLFSGAESGIMDGENVTNTGAVTVVSSPARSGSFAFQVPDAPVGSRYLRVSWTQVLNRWFYTRCWFRLTAIPASATRIAQTLDTSTLLDDVWVRANGTLSVLSGTGPTSAPIAANEWHCLEIGTWGDGASRRSAFRLDGVQFDTRLVTTNLTANIVRVGWPGGGPNVGSFIYLDDIAVNDDTGGENDSWPDVDGKIYGLLPSANEAVGIDWRGGAGADVTPNHYDRVNDRPPAGVSNGAAGADNVQIRNAVAGSVQPADFRLPSYDSVVGVNQDIKAVQTVSFMARTGAGALETKLVSNPVGAVRSITPSGTAIGTFPSSANWPLSLGAVMSSPSVDPAVGPVLRVAKAAGNTGIGACCFAMVMVEVEPSAQRPLPIGGVASALQVGGARIIQTSVNPGGVAPETVVGGPTLFAPILLPGGVPLKSKAGGATVAATLPLTPGGVPAGTVGGVDVSDTLSLLPGGVPSVGTVGGVQVVEADAVRPGGIASTADVGPVMLSQERGQRISSDFQERWESGLQIAGSGESAGALAARSAARSEARPGTRVEIRTGRYWRRNARWLGPPMDVQISGVDGVHPWQAFWTPHTPAKDYRPIPNVRQVNLEQSNDQNGLTTATITIDNIFYKPEAGGHHSIKRGYMAPLRGYTGPGQAAITDEQGEILAKNEWFGLLSRGAQITVHQSYGDAEIKTFTGIIEDADTTSRPDVITVTARDFGKMLTDSRVFGWNKEPHLKDPVRFVDEDYADDITTVGYDPDASSQLEASDTEIGGDSDRDYEADNVLDGDGDTSWISAPHSSRGVTEYVQIRLPEGRYDDFNVSFPGAGGMDMYVSLLPKKLKNGDMPTWNNEDIDDNTWIDGGGDHAGEDVPGTNGGHAYLRLIEDTPTGSGHRYHLHGDDSFRVGKDSILRLSFRNLVWLTQDPDDEGFIFCAGVVALKARHRVLKEEAKQRKWVRCGDASDVVRQILRWAGFKDWIIESTGTALSKPLVVNRGMTYMDVIVKMKEITGYTFYMGDPVQGDDTSIGVPVFRKSLIVTDAAPVMYVDDNKLLNAVDVKHADESLAYIIRTRGRASSGGKKLGGDSQKRIMYVFRPPWSYRLTFPVSARPLDQLAGIIKHLIHTDNMYKTKDDVKFAAYYIALNEALSALTASIQISGHPGPQLDDHIALTDLGTGVTSRLSVQSRSSTYERSADRTSWAITIGGALVDEPDVAAMVKIINNAKRA